MFEDLCLTAAPKCVALGFFDGVHIGHQRLIRALENDLGLQRTVFTFANHPISVLQPDHMPGYLTNPQEKASLLRSYGAQMVWMPAFDRQMAALAPEDFLEFLFDRLNAKRIVVGANYRFGAGAAGNAEMIQKAASARGLSVQIVPDVLYQGALVSSTRIRAALASGAIDQAAAMLGRPYALCGPVVHGRKIGSQMQLPTANLGFDFARALPMDGVYAGEALLDRQRWRCVINIGASPTVATKRRTVEAHLIGFEGDLYGQQICLRFDRFLRPEKQLGSLDALKAQIRADIDLACMRP